MRCQLTGRCVIVSAFLAAAAQPLCGQVVEVPPFEVGRPTFRSFIQGLDVAAAPDGTLLFTWGEQNLAAGSRSDIAVTRPFSRQAVALASPSRVDTSASVQWDPVIAAAPSGGYIAGWLKEGVGVVSRRLDALGRGTGSEVGVDPLSYAAWRRAEVAELPAGWVFAWMANDTGDGPHVWAHVFDSGGESRGAPVAVTDGSYMWAYYVDVAALSDGGFVVAWFDVITHLSSGRLFDANGLPRSPVFLLSNRMAVNQVAGDPAGGFAIVGSYTDQTDLHSWGDTNWLFVRRFSNSGEPLGDEIAVYEDAPGTSIYASDIAFDPAGNFLAVWSRMDRNPGFHPAQARAFDSQGNPYGPPIDVSTAISGNDVRVASLPDGAFVVAWRANNPLAVQATILRACVSGSGECGAAPTPLPTNTPAATATSTPTSTPTPTPAPPVCGDAIIGSGEQCDDGNLIDGDGCDSNCTWTRCGNGIVAGGEECDDGNTVSGDGCDANCLIEECGDGRVEGDEECDDGNGEDGDGCQSDCTRTPRHDSVVLPVDPIKFFIGPGQDDAAHNITVQVSNADEFPNPERPGHLMQLLADDGDCPWGTIEEGPDFGGDPDQDPDTVLVPGGQKRTARVWLRVYRADFPDLDPKVPQRCTVTFEVDTLIDGNVDPIPENNIIHVELNIFGKPDAQAAAQSARARAADAPPPFFVVSAKPLRVNILAGQSVTQQSVRVAVGAGKAGAVAPQSTVTVTASDGNCPAGTVGVSDFDSHTPGGQAVVPLPAGRVRRGTLPVSVRSAGFTAGSGNSPARCTALITSTGSDGAAEPANHVTKLLIEVRDGNDF